MEFGFIHLLKALTRDRVFRFQMPLVAGLIGGGALFYTLVEHFHPIDSVYFCVIMLATIGFGDFAPVTHVGKLFTIFYVIIGIAIVSSLIANIVTVYQREVRHHSKRFQYLIPPTEAGETDEAPNDEPDKQS